MINKACQKKPNQKKKTAKSKSRHKAKSPCRDLAKKYKFYAVAQGWHQKICFSQGEACNEVGGYKNPILRGFNKIEEAAAYIKAFNEEKRQLILKRGQNTNLIHLGPKTQEAAEKQYREGTYASYATCRNIKRHKRGS